MTFWLLCLSKAQGFDVPSSCCRMSTSKARAQISPVVLVQRGSKIAKRAVRGPQGEGEWLSHLCPSSLAPQQVSPAHFCAGRGNPLGWHQPCVGQAGKLGVLTGNLHPCLQLCLVTHLRATPAVWNREAGCRNAGPRYPSESHSLCMALICISHSSFVQCQLCTVPVVFSSGCKRPDCLRKTEAEQLLLWCQVLQPTSLSFVLLCYCVFAASLNAELLEGMMQLSQFYACAHCCCDCTQIVRVALERGWMLGSCCLMIKGVMLLMEASGAEICAHTPGNTCPVISSSCVRPAAHMLQK